MTTPTLPILEVLNDLMDSIRDNHPEVPPVTIVLGAKGVTRGRTVHGHFAPESWVGESAHEIMLSGESLSRGAGATLGTLIHEAAHAVAHATGVKDTSNKGRYHNAKFKAIAEGMGISLEQAPTIGWSKTTLAEGTEKKYEAGLNRLAGVLTTYKKAPMEAVAGTEKPRKSTKIKIDCECGTPVSVSKQWFEDKGDITCGDCLSTFMPVE
jgi:hypothetical protein